LGAAACAAALGFALGAQAQTISQRGSPMIIDPAPPPPGELVAPKGAVLLSQPMRSVRAARLEEESPTSLGLLFGPSRAKTLAAGVRLFGVELPDGWGYCAVVQGRTWFFENADETVCFQDRDGDGRFDRVRRSGRPFDGIPLMVFQPGPPAELDRPVRYSLTPYRDGPAIDFAISWRKTRPSPRAAEGAVGIAFGARLIAGKASSELQGKETADLVPGVPTKVTVAGAELQLLGFTPEGALRYRVERAMPAQVRSIDMTLTTTTYFFVY
jgi:hypothetical protein